MKLNIIKNRYTYFGISAILLVLSISSFLFWNLNYGVDMTWWTQAEYNYEHELDIDKLKADLVAESKNIVFEWSEAINGVSLYKTSWENKVTVTTWFNSDIELKILEGLKNTFREKTLEILKIEDSTIYESKYTNIGKSFWDYIKNTAITTLIIAIIAIAIYVMYAFSWVASGISVMSFAVITIITLFHDVIASTGLYLLTSMYFPEFKIDTFFITALLTILWYSINDTIVVFDRIRSNIKKLLKKKNLEEIIEISIKDTLRRSIFTSLTLFFVLLSVFLFWPESISGFILALMFGTLIWTYSSIFIASPLLFEFNKNKKLSEFKEKKYNPEDKIVV